MDKKKTKKLKEKTLEESDDKASDAANSGSTSDKLAESIKNAAEGLYYVSETDAEIKPFIGQTSQTVTPEEILKQTDNSVNSVVEQIDFSNFFSRLTKIQDWFGDEEKANANKFVRLKEVLENNLRELKVFKVGKIRLDIYAVGLDENDKLLGIKTKAVET
jgi:Nuclease A inhibitor-like protein